MDTHSPDNSNAEDDDDSMLQPQNVKQILLTEYDSWYTKNSNLLHLKSECFCDDGRIKLEFAFGKNKGFTLFCPLQYPNYEDNFFVEAPAPYQLWCNSINEFILDSDSKLTLETILYKAASLFYKNAGSSPSRSSSDSEEETEEDMMLADSSDEEWEDKIFQKKKKWRLKEAHLRAVTKHPKTSDMFQGSVKDHPKQVFSNSGTSGILTNDLIAIMRSAKNTGINAEPINDNIYKWSVFLSSFNPDGKLEQDLRQLHKQYGYNYIQFQLTFAMDLYPFYPPIMKVVRPRLQGSMMVRIASLLNLSSWNPARDMKSVLEEIKQYLEMWARVDLSCKRNDMSLYPQTYFSIENHLMYLACVSEIPPRANLKFPEISGDAAMINLSNNEEEKKKNKKDYFPAGTGFSTDIHTGWDINAFEAAKKEKDDLIKQILQNIIQELRGGCFADVVEDLDCHFGGISNHTFCSFSVPSCSSLSPMKGSYASLVTQKSVQSWESLFIPKPDQRLESAENGHYVVSPCANGITSDVKMETNAHQNSVPSESNVEDLFNVLEASSLVPLLESKLSADTFLEICQHTSLYQCIVDVVVEIASSPVLIPLLWNLSHQQQSIYSLISRLEGKAKAIIVRLGKTSANGNIPKGKPGDGNGSSHEPSEEEKLARSFYQMSQLVSSALKDAGLLTLCDSNPSELAPLLPNGIANGSATLAQTYKDALKDMQFLSCDIEVDGANAHYYSSNFKVALPPNSAQVMRIAQEMSALSTALPLDLESAIFVRTDDAKFTLLKALIIGPEGTPYSSGCFQFDIFFPPRYPTAPPQVQLRTTGLGRVRFNPNLYANGNVCLSLLGTWKGLQGEQWHHTSTLLQVLISIQSLILVAEPYFNEPGFELMMGTLDGSEQSRSYNKNILIENMKHAIIGQLRRPSLGFEEVIRTHFRIKKDRILEEMCQYLTIYDSKDFKSAYQTLKDELEKLACSPDSTQSHGTQNGTTDWTKKTVSNVIPEEIEPS